MYSVEGHRSPSQQGIRGGDILSKGSFLQLRNYSIDYRGEAHIVNMPHTQSIWQHSRAYILAISIYMGIFMFGYDTVGRRGAARCICADLLGTRRWSYRSTLFCKEIRTRQTRGQCIGKCQRKHRLHSTGWMVSGTVAVVRNQFLIIVLPDQSWQHLLPLISVDKNVFSSTVSFS
jgi:hypothetical protein